MQKLKTPLIGSAYYPEDWPEEEMDRDIAKMKEFGLNVARIAEFAWHKMEPKEGEFDFGWLHTVVDKLAAADIRVIMGTPTAVPPIWVTASDPDMFVEGGDGQKVNHGGRRHACSNNPTYLAHCDHIVTALAKEFGEDKNIVGWQIDNELGPQNCHCRHCTAKFQRYLQNKYKTIEELNRCWNLNLFSSAYQSFDQIIIPHNAWIHPSHQLEYLLFAGESAVAFIARQAAILKKYVKAPISTDQMPFNKYNFREMNRPLDLVQFNHYNRTGDFWESAFWMDYLRPLKEAPFWVTETSTCWNGGTAMPGGINRDGCCYANTWMPLALGGEANLYWLWRTHWVGHELMHGSVLESCGRPQYNICEVEQAAAEFRKAADFVQNTKVVSDVAIHFTFKNDALYKTQQMVYGFDYERNIKTHFYKPLIDSGLRPDVIDAAEPLERYRLLFSPMTAILDEDGLPERIAEWVKNGGVWVTGPMTDIRTADGAKYIDRYHGMLESLTPARFKHMVPDADGMFKGAWTDGSPFEGSWYYECFEPNAEADLAVVRSGSRYLEGMSILQHYSVGKGTVIVLGTLPRYDDMRRLLRFACQKAGVECDRTEGNSLLVAERQGAEHSGVILLDICGNGGVYHNNRPLTDRLTGEAFTGDIPVQPYQVRVLEA